MNDIAFRFNILLSEGWRYGTQAAKYEGIGGLQHFFFTKHWWCTTAPDYIRGLRCFDSPVDGLTFYEDRGDCDTVVVVENVVDATAVAIFPNPLGDQLTVQVEGIFDIHLFDVYGRLLQTKTNVQESVILNTASYKKGCYFLRIRKQDKRITKKIVKG